MIAALLPKLHGHLPEDIYNQLPGILSFGIDGPKRLSNFLGQCAHESLDFTDFTENLNYSAQALANTWPKRFAIDPASTVKVPNELAKSIQKKPEKIANTVYANRMGNGDEASGDGYKYSGKGCIQLTGKENCQAFFKAIGVSIDSDPSLIATHYQLLSAAWFFKNNELWPICDRGVDYATVTILTRRINGANLVLAERYAETQKFYKILTT